MADIVMIPIDRLNPHPDNPRKDLGDLTELTESIRAKGVLQNLTVVPYYSKVQKRVMEGLYTILIGHRRAAAAKEAGLTELPCTVVDMSYEDQIATMLVENIQRSDLTLYEEAKGFQMMLDLGKSVAEVSAMSGFSETTVRRRVKLAAFDEKKFKKAVERGATLFDFAKLDEVEDPAVRDELLNVIGKPDFKNELAYALKKQSNRKLVENWARQASAWAQKAETVDWSGPERTVSVNGTAVPVAYVRNYCTYGSKTDSADAPEDAGSARYFYIVSDSQVDIYKELTKAEKTKKAVEDADNRRRRDAFEKKRGQFAEMAKRHRELRFEFVRNFSQFQKRDADVWEFVIEAMVSARRNGGGFCSDSRLAELGEILGVEFSEKAHDLDYHAFLDAKRQRPEHTALLTAMWILDRGSYYTDRWDAERKTYVVVPCESKSLDSLYRLLSSLGYVQSTEERDLRNGTHRLFDGAGQDG